MRNKAHTRIDYFPSDRAEEAIKAAMSKYPGRSKQGVMDALISSGWKAISEQLINGQLRVAGRRQGGVK